METAITAFLITIGIVSAILIPVVLVLILSSLPGLANAFAAYMERKAEELKRRPPFDDVEINQNPATNVVTARLIRHGDIIWQGSVSRNELVEKDADDPVRFSRDAE